MGGDCRIYLVSGLVRDHVLDSLALSTQLWKGQTLSRISVVTGGAGFIGSHLVRALLAHGDSVRVIDNFSTGKSANLDAIAGDLTVHPVSFTDLDAITPIIQGAEVVYHLGALASVPRSVATPIESHHHNVTGTLNVLVAARDGGVRRVVYAASSSAYGSSQ